MAFSRIPFNMQPMTPVSPCAPTPMPLVQEPIPPLPMTPPESDQPYPIEDDDQSFMTAIHVISTERDALANLENIYRTQRIAQDGFGKAVVQTARTIRRGGKLVICGVGKSGKIGEKLVATMNSLAISAVFLHPTEALHGDLGIIRTDDTVLFVTYSGQTPELRLLLPHIPAHIPIIIMTSHLHPSTCPLLSNRSNGILLPAPIHESETLSFGLAAPTSSTTVALALGDALALATAKKLHTLPSRSPADVFRQFHPGGAIGAAATSTLVPFEPRPRTISDIATSVDSIPIAQPRATHLRTLDLMLTAVRSPKGWVRVSPSAVIAPRRLQRLTDMEEPVSEYIDETLVLERESWISVLAGNTVQEVRDWIVGLRTEPGERGKQFLKRGTVLGVVDDRSVVSAVVEIEDIMEREEDLD